MFKELRLGFFFSGCGSLFYLDIVVYLVCFVRMEVGVGWSFEIGVFWRGRNLELLFGGIYEIF